MVRFTISMLNSSVEIFVSYLTSKISNTNEIDNNTYCLVFCGPVGIGKTFVVSRIVSRLLSFDVNLNSPYFCYYKSYYYSIGLLLHVDVNRLPIDNINLFIIELIFLYKQFKYLVVECVSDLEMINVHKALDSARFDYLTFKLTYGDADSYFIDCSL